MPGDRTSRRKFIRLTAAAGMAAVTDPASIPDAFANRHPHPRTTSLPYLDRNMVFSTGNSSWRS